MKKSNTTLFKISDILDQLLIDARQSLQKIAEKCDTYRQKVWREQNKLEESHAIWGYTAVVDEEKLGWRLFMVLLKTRPMTTEFAQHQIQRIREDIPGTMAVRLIDVYHLTGTYDWIVVFAAKNWATARKYFDNLRKAYWESLLEKPELCSVAFTPIRWGKVNPELENLQEFVSP
ncbi:MAG: Lrp/AsnC family transcriptional regulator [Thermoplasmatota archaeon]